MHMCPHDGLLADTVEPQFGFILAHLGLFGSLGKMVTHARLNAVCKCNCVTQERYTLLKVVLISGTVISESGDGKGVTRDVTSYVTMSSKYLKREMRIGS